MWETFCDSAYYDMWAVRRVDEKDFGSCYHVPSKEEAEKLACELETKERKIDTSGNPPSTIITHGCVCQNCGQHHSSAGVFSLVKRAEKAEAEVERQTKIAIGAFNESERLKAELHDTVPTKYHDDIVNHANELLCNSRAEIHDLMADKGYRARYLQMEQDYLRISRVLADNEAGCRRLEAKVDRLRALCASRPAIVLGQTQPNVEAAAEWIMAIDAAGRGEER